MFFSKNKLVSLVVTGVMTSHALQAPALAQTEGTSWDTLSAQGDQLESTGDLRGAEKSYKDAYQMAKSFDMSDVRRMKSTENLASVYEQEGRYTIAQATYQEAFELRQKEYGEGNARLSKSYYNIGRVQLEAGDYTGARRNLTRGLNLRQFASSEEKNMQDLPLVLILFNLGVLETETGNFEKAEEYLNRCQTIAQNIAKHKECSKVLSQLALVSISEEDYSKAENQAYTALNMADRFAKDDPLVRAQALDSVAMVKLARNELSEASKAANEAWGLKRKVLGDQHPVTANTLLVSGLIKLAEKKPEAAEASFDQAIGVYEHTINKHHLNYYRALMGRAFCQLKQRDKKAAQNDLDQAISLLATNGAGKHLAPKYKDLFIQKLGPTYSMLDVLREKVKTPDAVSIGKFDVFGILLSGAMAGETEPDTFLFCNYKDVFAVLGVTFVVLVLLAMAVMIPGAFSAIFPWGKVGGEDNKYRTRKRSVEVEQPSAQEAEKRKVLRRTTETERRQVQLWKGRLNTMEQDIPKAAQTGTSSGEFDRINFEPLGKSNQNAPLVMPPNVNIELGSGESNGESYKW